MKSGLQRKFASLILILTLAPRAGRAAVNSILFSGTTFGESVDPGDGRNITSAAVSISGFVFGIDAATRSILQVAPHGSVLEVIPWPSDVSFFGRIGAGPAGVWLTAVQNGASALCQLNELTPGFVCVPTPNPQAFLGQGGASSIAVGSDDACAIESQTRKFVCVDVHSFGIEELSASGLNLSSRPVIAGSHVYGNGGAGFLVGVALTPDHFPATIQLPHQNSLATDLVPCGSGDICVSDLNDNAVDECSTETRTCQEMPLPDTGCNLNGPSLSCTPDGSECLVAESACHKLSEFTPGPTPSVRISVPYSTVAPPIAPFVIQVQTASGPENSVLVQDFPSTLTGELRIGSLAITLGGPDLQITKRVRNQYVKFGEEAIGWYIEVTNVGDSPTNGPITITDNLPAGLTLDRTGLPNYLNAADDPSFSPVSNSTSSSLNVTINGLAPGRSFGFDVPVIGEHMGQWSNTASVSGGGDATPGNNTATALDKVSVLPPRSRSDVGALDSPGIALIFGGR